MYEDTHSEQGWFIEQVSLPLLSKFQVWVHDRPLCSQAAYDCQVFDKVEVYHTDKCVLLVTV